MRPIHNIPFPVGSPEYQRARKLCCKQGVKYSDLSESDKSKVTGQMTKTRQDSAGSLEAFREIADEIGWEIANLTRSIKQLTSAIKEKLGDEDAKKRQ
jgi:hypothetical protein